jgi:hypothetical protein
MSKETDIEKRERNIDEALKETFPASDPPAFIGGREPIHEPLRKPDKEADVDQYARWPYRTIRH